MTKIKILTFKITTALLIAFWMLVITGFSAQPGDDSASLSGAVAAIVVSVEENLTGNTLSDVDRQERIDFWQFPVRKAAHFSVYAVLGLLFYLHLLLYPISQRKQVLLAWLFTTLFAIIDETHQIFVPGRVGSVVDVLIDSAGGITAIFTADTIRSLKLRKVDK